jgi:hypothetical protein
VQKRLAQLNGDERDVRFLMRAGVPIEAAIDRVTVAKAVSHANIDAVFANIERQLVAAGGLKG